MSAILYDIDSLEWSEQQAELLRRLASGERVNQAIDWENVIEDVGRWQLTGCQSLLRQALLHLLKLQLGENQPADHWRTEIAGFLADAQARFSPSMRQRIDIQGQYDQALRKLRAGFLAARLAPLPQDCPITLDDLLDPRLDVPALEGRFLLRT